MTSLRFRLGCLIFVLVLVSMACLDSPTPAPGELVTMDNVCKFDGQMMEVDGQLILPNGVSCSSEEPFTCDLYLEDPFSHNTIPFSMPVMDAVRENLPVNYMATLPDSYQMNDFFIHTSDGKWARNHSFVTVRGKISANYGGKTCSFIEVESVTWLKRLMYTGMDLKQVTLQQALTDGLVVASITGNGLSQINLTLKPNVDLNLEVEIEPGTMFISGSEGVQNMVLRQEEIVYLKPELEVSVELEVSCANMELKMPEYTDIFTIGETLANEDLLLLLKTEEFLFQDLEVQQFAIWTITDNPSDPYSYVAIEMDGYAHYPQDFQIQIIKELFEEAGIDTGKYRIFGY